MLTKAELQKLREQITLNSIYVADYENNMGIKAHIVCDFFDGYVSYLQELEKGNGEDLPIEEFFDKYDTIDNLWDWYCCFDENPLPTYMDVIISKAEKAGFTVTCYDTDCSFSRYSPADQDFSFNIDLKETCEEFANEVYAYYEAYDPSYEAYLWLDSDGHGKNGAPYEMGDVYDDMKACEGFIYELYEIIMEEI